MNKANKMDIAAIVAIGFLAFGLQIAWLGFFQDDWNFVYYYAAHGAHGLLQFLILDGRPGSIWIYALGFSLFGYKPALWQLFSITLQILTTINFLFILKAILPTRRYGNLIACVIFLTYPFYSLQPLSVSYAQHYVSYCLYSLSIILMIRASEQSGKYLQYSIPAIVCAFLHLFAVEYFVGLELLRPIILWFLPFIKENDTGMRKVRRVLLAWLPYLLVLMFFIFWRSAFSAMLGIRNNPLDAITNPIEFIGSIARNTLADLVLMLFSSWSRLINHELFVIGPIRNFYFLASSLIGGLCFYFLVKPAQQADAADTPIGIKSVLSAGGLIYVTGIVAAYSIGYIVNIKISPWNERFALPVLLGLALMVSGIVELLITSKNIRHVFLACLVGLLVGYHNNNTLIFKSAWEKQERFYEQLSWRAPSITPGTAIIANEEILGYMGDYPTSLAINSMYKSNPTMEVPYWFFAASENFNSNMDIMANDLTSTRGAVIFHGKSTDALFITYEPENGQCLWVLHPGDEEYKYLPSNMKKAALTSNIGNIHEQANTSALFTEVLNENKGTWCYYYEKSDLARQQGDWKKVASLWQEAQNKKLRPYNGFEFIPFIEANAHLGKWEEALQLTKKANLTTGAMYFILCPTWERLANETPPAIEKDAIVTSSYKILKCVPS